MAYYIYGTLYNNINRIKECLDSLKPLEPYKLFVVDNYSDDGSYEYLVKRAKLDTNIELHITRKKCSRGKGKDIALKMLFSVNPKEDDLVFYIDFDVIYGKNFITYIKNYFKNHKDEVTTAFGIGIAQLNNFEWKDLNLAEDFERFARMKSLGIKIFYNPEMQYNNPNWFENYKGGDESRYANNIKYFIRAYKGWIDIERGIGFKNFKSFYADAKTKSSIRKFFWLTAYIIAKILGIYCYNKEVDNRKYILGKYKYVHDD
ncbi:MAG: glycosyltransferase family A protein [Candidatus Micrarchaeaceae archaeon]